MKNALQTNSTGLIIRQKEPTNLETPLDQVDSYLTPTELFYIRSHFLAPKLELASYELRVDGAVKNPISLSYKQLRDMPSETRLATLECAGNSRVFLIPQVSGAQWELGAVGNAEWTGVPLAELLERVGLEEDACEIVLEGADRGTPAEPPVESVLIGLQLARQALYARIDRRIDAWLAAGFVDEVQGLLDRGYDPNLPSMSGIGYREIAQFLQGQLALDEAAELIKLATHQYAKRQMTWFRRHARIQWLDAESLSVLEVLELISS